jgi:hypothetical protein
MKYKNLIPFNLAETLLLNLNVFRFLDSVDGGYEDDDPLTIDLVQRFYAKYYGGSIREPDEVMPLLTNKTSLVLLTPLFVFGSSIGNEYWDQIGFKIEDDYQITYEDSENGCMPPTLHEVLDVLSDSCRNMVDSLCDDRFGAAIFTAGDGIVFRSHGYQLTFGSTVGLGRFIQQYVHVMPRTIRERLLLAPQR